MDSPLAYTSHALRRARSSPSPARLGLYTGLVLLVLPAIVATTIRLGQPDGAAAVIRIFGAEKVLIAAAQVAIAIVAVRRRQSIRLALVSPIVAGVVVAAGDVISFSRAFDIPASFEILPAFAYDVVLGFALALPVVVFLQAASVCRTPTPTGEVDASAEELLAAYDRVREKSTSRPVPWRLYGFLTSQLVRRHVRRTLEDLQRGYAARAVVHDLDAAEARDRQKLGDYLLAVPPISKIVPVPTVATVFVLWKLVPVLVGLGLTASAWVGGNHLRVDELPRLIGKVVPTEAASLVIDGLALLVAFPLLMFVIAPAIHKRDRLLAGEKVCEREVILMSRIKAPRSSRRFEYVLAGLPAAPVILFGGAMLVYAIAGLFVYPSPKGPLGNLVRRADLMHLGPVTGVVLAQVLLAAAAAWIAWIVKARRQTRVVLL
jgi:hypothetical protein